MQEVVIVAATRTAIGSFGGQFAKVPAHELGATVIRRLLDETEIDPASVDEVIFGQVLTADCGQNPARQAAIHAGLPHSVPALTLNKVCGSGLKALHLAAQAIRCGDAEIMIAGGQESMSLSPHIIPTSRTGQRMGHGQMIDTMIQDGLWDAFNNYHMGITAENLAEKWGISREEQDAFAAESHHRAAAAIEAGYFKEQIAPVTLKTRKGDVIFDTDEHVKPGTTAETLAKLRPAFKKDGTVTAGNASGLNDGAAFMVLASAQAAEKAGQKPIARVVSYAVAGVPNHIMGEGPIPATIKALSKAGLSVADMDVIESNEAFASQALAVAKGLELDLSKTNPNGGAIALGHPVGCSGAFIATKAIYELQRTGGKYALVTMCIGGGQGIAVIFERV